LDKSKVDIRKATAPPYTFFSPTEARSAFKENNAVKSVSKTAFRGDKYTEAI
jgi:hypothetical protein